jgi:N-acetylglucosamine-6-phosphate deacetylase
MVWPLGQDATARTVKVGGNRWRAPALFDPQINGAMGIAFNSPKLTPEGVRTVAEVCRGHGIGGFLATVITDGCGEIGNAFRTLESARQGDPEIARWIPGYHLEGPYIASEDGPRGAHPRQHARDPDWDEFRRWQDAAGGGIRMLTLAPERDGAIGFIEKVAGSGVVVALGHTNANAETIRAAVEAGARTSTHLGNGCHAVLPRHENPIWIQLGEDRLWASIIADGHHLPAGMVKGMVRAKTLQRVLLTCDAGSLAGLPPGRYAEWGTELEVLPSGRIVVPGTPFLAGSGSFTDRCVANVVDMAGITIGEAVELAADQPRRLLGLPPTDERIEFDWQPGRGLENIRFVK